MDSAFSADTIRLRFESRSSQNKNMSSVHCSFYDSKIFRDRSQVCLNTITYNNFCLKKNTIYGQKGLRSGIIWWLNKLGTSRSCSEKGGVRTLIFIFWHTMAVTVLWIAPPAITLMIFSSNPILCCRTVGNKAIYLHFAKKKFSHMSLIIRK